MRGIVWQVDAAINWSSCLGSGENYKHTDCHGNCTIDAINTVDIMANFGLAAGSNINEMTICDVIGNEE